MVFGRGDIRGSCAFQDVVFIIAKFLAQLEQIVTGVIKQEVRCTSHLFCEVLR